MKRVSWRVIESGPGDAAWNMAVDEALLDVHEEQGGAPVLRLYRWRPAAISLGRFQPAAEVAPPPGVDVVRRITGGAALFHQEDEVTYSVVAPYAVFGSRSPRVAYRAIHGVIRRALEALRVELGERAAPPAAATVHGMCFDVATDYDLVAGGKKLVGSAQRRRGKTFLQHGALPRSPDPLSPGAISLSELSAALPSPDQVAEAIRSALAAELAADLVDESLSEGELDRAESLRATRYAEASWTHAR